MKHGLTLMELVIAVAIVALVVGIALSSLGNYRNREVLKSATLEVVSVLREAQTKTLVAEGNSVYGVHVDSNRVVLFLGSVYNVNSGSNVVSVLPESLALSTSTLGVSNIVFNRLSGAANVSGSIIIYRLAEPEASTTVTINAAGIISSP